jgi:hypothetical protein
MGLTNRQRPIDPSTTRPWRARGQREQGLVLTSIAMGLLTLLPMCGWDWDSYDPALGGAAGGAGTGGSVGGGGTGGAGGTGGSVGGGGTGGAAGTGGAGGGGGGCPAVGTLTDDFNAAIINGTLWTPYVASPATLVEGSGNVTFDVPTLGNRDFTLTSNISYDLRGAQAHLEAPNFPGFGTFRLILRSGADEIRIGFSGSGSAPKLSVQTYLNSVLNEPVLDAYDDVNDRWLQLKETSGTVYWQTSPNGITWTDRYSTATSGLFSMACVVVEIAGHAGQAGFSMSFDNFNL